MMIGKSDISAGYTKHLFIHKNTWDSASYLDFDVLIDKDASFEITWYDWANHSNEWLVGEPGSWGWCLHYTTNENIYWATNNWTGGGKVLRKSYNNAVCKFNYLDLNGVEYGWSDTSSGSPSKKFMARTGVWVSEVIVYKNNVKIRDLIPATNEEGVVGMFDLINKTFYSDAGTGNGFNFRDTI